MLIVLLLALLPAAAAEAKPLTLGAAGSDPHIAVDQNGTAHIAWNERVAGDDLLRYCRLPRGAGACAPGTPALQIPGEDFEGPRVLYANGLLTLITERCCTSGDDLLILQSSDGGQSFSAPRSIATTPSFSNFSPLRGDGQAIYGPGLNQISVVSSGTGGTYYQAAPTDTGTETSSSARVDDDVAGSTADSARPAVGLFDPLTPLVAYEHLDSDRIFVRTWKGAGAYNDSGNWTPSQPLPGTASEPRLATGLGGAYLIYRAGQPNRQSYRVRRVSRAAAGVSFGGELAVSDKGSPIFRDFTQDLDGHLHAAWVDNGSGGDPDRLRYGRSLDGKRFSDPTQLAKGNDNIFQTALGAAPDGGGWVLWSTDSGTGAIKAAPFGPIGGGGGGGGPGAEPCVPKLTYGKVVILAREGCLQKDGKRYSTADPIRVNGIDIDPQASGAGAEADAAAGGEIVIDTGPGTLKSGMVTARAGKVKLAEQKLSWKLPKSGGEIRDLAGNPAVFATGKLNLPLLGLPVSGQTTVSIGGGASAKIPVHLMLPEPFGGLLGNAVTAEAVLRLNNVEGLILDDLHLRADSIWLGIAEVRDFDLAYTSASQDLFDGSARILLPVAKAALDPVQFGLIDGGFNYGRATLQFPGSGIAIAGPFVFLKSIGFEILTNPTKLAGLANVTAGPTVPVIDKPAANVIGAVSYTFPDAPQGGVFLIDGEGFIADIKTADAFVRFETPDKLSLGAHVEVPPGGAGGFGPKLSGNFDGKMDLGTGSFNIGAKVAVENVPTLPLGEWTVDGLLSSKAVAGCAAITVPNPTPPPLTTELAGGLGYYWGGPLDPFAGCDLAPFRAKVSAQGSATSAGFQVAKGLPQLGLKLSGKGSAPAVTLTGPAGQTLSSAPDGGQASNDVGAIGPYAGSSDTYALLNEPQAGSWTVTVSDGSAEIAGLATAEGLPQVKIEARVRKLGGRKRELIYDARKIDGQRISFYESGKGAYSLLGRARGTGGKGKLRFSAADGPKGRRLILAAVESFGAPREQLSVASYKAPKPIRPAKPKRLRARRRGGRLALSWKRARAAKRYVVAVALKDGRRLELSTRRPKLKIPDVPGIDSARIKVAGLKTDNTPGPAAKTKLKAKPKKRGKGKRRRATRSRP